MHKRCDRYLWMNAATCVPSRFPDFPIRILIRRGWPYGSWKWIMECHVTQEAGSLLYASFISYITMRISRILPPWLFGSFTWRFLGWVWVFLEDSPSLSSSSSSCSSSSLFSSQLPEEVPICYINEPWPWFAHQVSFPSCSLFPVPSFHFPVPWALIVLRPGLVYFLYFSYSTPGPCSHFFIPFVCCVGCFFWASDFWHGADCRLSAKIIFGCGLARGGVKVFIYRTTTRRIISYIGF